MITEGYLALCLELVVSDGSKEPSWLISNELFVPIISQGGAKDEKNSALQISD